MLLPPLLLLLAASPAEPCVTVEACVVALTQASLETAQPGDNPDVRVAIRALAKLGDPSVDAVRPLLADTRPQVAEAAARALAELGKRARSAEPQLLQALDSGVPGAAQALGALGDPAAAPLLAADLLRRGSPSDALALTKLGRPGFEALGGLFGESGFSEPLAQTVLEAFREDAEGMAGAGKALLDAAADASHASFVRLYALACLGELGDDAQELLPSLRDLNKPSTNSAVFQQAVLDTLAQLGDRQLAPVLVERIASDKWNERLAAFIGLAHLGPLAKSAVVPLIAQLSAPDFERRALAAEALGWIRDPRAVAPLKRVLEGNSWSVSEQAARALGRIGSRDAIPALQKAAAHHWDARVRRAATTALGELQSAHGAHPHDFHDVDRAREVQLAQSETHTCTPVDEGLWRVRRGEQTVALHVTRGGNDAPATLPAVLPPVRLGADSGFQERTRAHSVEDGWLVVQDAGEWGGALWFVGWGGKLLKLADEPLLDFIQTPQALWGIGALSHRRRSAGALWRLERTDGIWHAEPLAELPAAPLAWQLMTGGSLVVLTEAGPVEVTPEGAISTLRCQP